MNRTSIIFLVAGIIIGLSLGLILSPISASGERAADGQTAGLGLQRHVAAC